MLSGEGNAAENGKNNNRSNQQKSNFARAAQFFFVHFFAVVFHDYNVKLPGTSQLHVLCRECRTFYRSFFFSLPLIFTFHGGRQHFSFSHHRYKIFMVFSQQKNVSFVFYSRSRSLSPFFLDDLRWSAAYFPFFSVFLFLYIPNLWA